MCSQYLRSALKKKTNYTLTWGVRAMFSQYLRTRHPVVEVRGFVPCLVSRPLWPTGVRLRW